MITCTISNSSRKKWQERERRGNSGNPPPVHTCAVGREIAECPDADSLHFGHRKKKTQAISEKTQFIEL